MDEAAVKAIQKMSLSACSLENQTDIPGFLIPNDVKLTSAEQLLDRPARRRGIYQTSEIDDFVSYTSHYTDEKTKAVFIDPEEMTAVARLDHRIDDHCGWGSHIAKLILRRSPELGALRALLAARVSQAALADFIADWRDDLSFATTNLTGDGVSSIPIPIGQAYQRIRSLKTKSQVDQDHAQSDTSKSQSVTERVAVTSDPPTSMTMRCEPYNGLDERDIQARLVYHIDRGQPEIGVRLVGWEALRAELGREFLGLLICHDHLQDAYIGTYTDANTKI